MVFRFNLLATILLLFPCFILSQQKFEDSIAMVVKQIRKAPVDTAQINRLNSLGYRLIEIDDSLSKELLDEALSKSLKLKNNYTIADSYRFLGIWNSRFEKKTQALEYYRKSLKAASKENHLQLMAGAWHNMGNIKSDKGEIDSCIYFYQLSQKVFENPEILEEKGVKPNVIDKNRADLYSNMSTVFASLNNMRKADEYIDKSIAITQKYTSPKAKYATAYFMLQKADNYQNNGMHEKALQLRLKYLPFMEKNAELRSTLCDLYNAISSSYLRLNKLDIAMSFANKSLSLATETNRPDAISAAHFNIATIYFTQKNYALASMHLQKSAPYFEETEDPFEKRRYYHLTHQLAYQQKDYKKAYEDFTQYSVANDSLQKGEQARNFFEKEMRFETEKKENQIKLQDEKLKQKNILNWLLIGGLISLLIIAILSYRNYNQRKKIQQQRISELETEKQLLSTQSLLKGQEEERTRIAKDLHDGLGGLLSGVKLQLGAMKGNLILTEENGMAFNRALYKLDESISEMRRVAHNMMPETLLKFGLPQALQDYSDGLSHQQNFSIGYEFSGLENRLESSDEVVIYRIVQELINNSVKHSGASEIIVQLMKHDKTHLNITVEDNGKGFDQNIVDPSSAGLRNIKSRVKYLNGKIDIQSEPENGTSVYIECEVKPYE